MTLSANFFYAKNLKRSIESEATWIIFFFEIPLFKRTS